MKPMDKKKMNAMIRWLFNPAVIALIEITIGLPNGSPLGTNTER